MPSLIRYEMPRNTLMEPSVTMNGASFRRVMHMPLRKPHRAPQPIPNTVPKSIESQPMSMKLPPEMAVQVPPPAKSMPSEPSMPHIASIEPTERSIPAVMMMKVMPAAMIPLTEERRSTFEKFWRLRKFSGSSAAHSEMMKISEQNGSSCLANLFMMKWFPYWLDVAARRMIFSCVAPAADNSPRTDPSRMTRIRSQIPSSSGSSEEITRIAFPCAASSFSSR